MDKFADILIVLIGFLYIIIVILLINENLFSLLLTVPLTIFSVAWLRQADWTGFLK